MGTLARICFAQLTALFYKLKKEGIYLIGLNANWRWFYTVLKFSSKDWKRDMGKILNLHL
jgi:hypothetical protein